MTWIVYRPNIYDPSKDIPSYVGNCKTVREALIARFGTDQFDLPTYITVNRVPTLRADWDNPILPMSTIEVITIPGAMSATVLTVLTVASLLVTAYSLYVISNIPSVATGVGASVPDTSPVFTFAGQKNIQRLNNPVDSVYGKMRWWPAYLCTPRVEYVNNKPMLHLWFSLGQGNFEIEDVRVNDTSISTITGAAYTQHDDPYTMVASDDFDLVNYAEDFSNTELLGTNEDDHAVLGPYNLNPTNTIADLIKVNFSYPSGLYGIDGSGNVTSATVNSTVYLTEIDNNGNETGATGEFTFVHTKSSTSPQRLTETLDPATKTGWVGTGRYTISAVRTNAKNKGTNGQDRCLIESAYSCGMSGKTFNVSVLHVILPGTSAVDSSAAEKVNVVATRKLPTISNGAFTTELYPTRNVVLAILDVLRNSAKIADADLDIPYWSSMIDLLSEYSFDYRFDSKSTVWNALQAMASCARAVPYYVGSDIRLSCDSAIKQPVLMLTADHASDFTLNIDFRTDMENDCIEAAYVDPETGLQDSVFFTPPGSEAKNPTKITFPGVTDRQTAWRLAAYTYLKRSLLRDRVTMTVSQDGKIPLLGEIVLLSMPLPAWTHAGIVESYTPNGASTKLALSDLTPYDSGWVALRRSDGSVYGPVQFTATPSTYEITLQAELSEVFDFSGDTKDFVAYTLSAATVATKRFEVESATPTEETVKLELIEFNPDVFAYDNLLVPDRGDDMEPYPAVSGAVPWLRVLDESGQYLRIEHGPIYGDPVSVTCKYIYVDKNDDYAYIAQAPWMTLDEFAIYTMQEADLVGSSHYVERQNNNLYIKFIVKYPSATFTTWWRGRVGDFGFYNSFPLHIWLKNNCNKTYVAPESVSNESSPEAQGVSPAVGGGFAHNAVFDVAERKLEIQTDAPPDSTVNVKVTCTNQVENVTKSLTKVSKDGGVVTFTERDMDVAGLLSVGSETTYPVVKLTTWREGALDKAAECFLDIKPLVTTPVGQTVKITRVSNEFYIPKVEAIVPNSTGQGTYVNFGENYGNISVKCSLLNGFTGISNNSFLASSQQTNSSKWSIEKIVSTKEGSAVFYRKAYPFFKKVALSESFFSATLFTVNQSVVDYITLDPYNPPGINYAVYGIAVDKDNKQILPGKILMLLPATSTRISQRPDNYHETMYPIRVLDNRYETPYNTHYSRELTTSELELFVGELDCVLLIGPGQSRFSTAFDQNPVGIGSVKCSQYDIFGHIGNTTDWGTYALF